MSIAVKDDDSLVNSQLASTAHMLSPDRSNFQVASVERRSTEADCTIVYDSQACADSLLNIVENTTKRAKKRRRISSSSEESPDRTNRSISPEIAYGTPAAYRIRPLQGDYLIVKIPMNMPRTRPKKCSDRDIARMLDSEDDTESIFDAVKESRGKIVGTLARGTPSKVSARTTRAASRETATKNTTSDSESAKEDRASLRIKLRRSTEQSNYKIQTIQAFDEPRYAGSRRSTAGTPKKYGSMDCREDRSINGKHTPKTATNIRAPKRTNEARTPTAQRTPRTKTKGNYCLESEESDSQREDDEAKDITSAPTDRSTRSTLKTDSETPQKRMRGLEEVGTPRSTRDTRNSRLIENERKVLEDNVDKENKTDNENDDDSTDYSHERSRGRAKSIVGTPLKQVKMLNGTPSPRRTPRRRIVDQEESTPKRAQRGATARKINEPVTPSTTTRRTSRVHTPSLKNGNLTPSMSRRTANISRAKTKLEEARAKLHVSAVPKSLPCREEEFNDIYQFLERKLLDNSAGCIYISGVPGTGKTATFNEAIRCLRKGVAKGDLNDFHFVEINGMKLSEPRQAYVQILKQINGQTLTWEQAHQTLEKRFTQFSSKRPMTLLLVDELDLLCNKRQDVVYNLLDWPAKTNSQLVVITIANTMDLPERVLMGRVTSRLGLTRLTFQPYTHKQLQEIVMARLKDSDAFKSEAIQLVARKVAAVSGDARRALDICRRATEIAESSDEKIVTMRDVNEALTEMIASAKVRAIKHCSEMEKLFLQAVCAEVTRTGVEETNFHNIYRQLESLCSFEGLKIPNVTQTLGICSRLGANRLLLCEHSRTDMQQRILLNVSSDDIYFATQTTDLV